MFDKEKFAKILINIKETYNNQEEFAKKSGVGRTYISQYMNCKIDAPPKPQLLAKISEASKGIISYDELMEICGYIDLYGLHGINLNDNEKKIVRTMLLDYRKYLKIPHSPFDIFDSQKYISNLPEESKNKIITAFRINSLDVILSSSEIKEEIDNNYFEYVAEDDAMYPLLDVGDIALVHKQDTIDKTNSSSNNAGTYLIKINNQNTIRIFWESQDKKSYTLEGRNMACKPILIQKSDLLATITILGKVVEIKNRSAFK